MLLQLGHALYKDLIQTGGASGALRQEFRELEILDDITRLQYEGKLSHRVVGDRRQLLIEAYREWKGDNYVPASVHKAIRWGKANPFQLDEQKGVIGWYIVKKPTDANKLTTDNQTSSRHLKRQLHHEKQVDTIVLRKKIKSHSHNSDSPEGPELIIPQGTQWSDNSCAYDCFVTPCLD